MGPIVPPAQGPSAWAPTANKAAALTRSGLWPPLLRRRPGAPGASPLGRLRRVGPPPGPRGLPPPPGAGLPAPSAVCAPAPACRLRRRSASAFCAAALRPAPLPRGVPPPPGGARRARSRAPGPGPPAACPWPRPSSGGGCAPRRLVGPCPRAACRALLCRARAGPPPGPFWGAPLRAPGGCGGCRSGCPLGVAVGPPGRFFPSAWARCLWSVVDRSWAALLGLLFVRPGALLRWWPWGSPLRPSRPRRPRWGLRGSARPPALGAPAPGPAGLPAASGCFRSVQ